MPGPKNFIACDIAILSPITTLNPFFKAFKLKKSFGNNSLFFISIGKYKFLYIGILISNINYHK